MSFTDEHNATEKGRQSFIKGLMDLEGDVTIVRNKLKKMITDFSKAEENASVELSSSLNRGVEIQRQVLCSLHKASSSGLLEPLENLNSLCPSKPDTLKSISIAKNNIISTLAILSPFVNLEATISKLKQEMVNDDKLPIVISQISRISDYKTKILNKATGESKPKLIQLFKPLDDFEILISSYIWKMVENAIEVTKKDPQALNKISKILEKFEENPEGKIKENIAKGIEKRLEWLLGTDKLDELAENTHTAVSELSFFLDKVLPNFQEKYNLREFVIKKYRDSIESAIEPHLSNLPKLRESPGLLVLIFQWISEYGEAIKKLCPGAIDEVEIQTLFAKVKELMPDFIAHMERLLSDWINRALKSHISNQQIIELAASNEPLTDTFPEEMFSAINQQLNFISNRLSGEVLIEVFRVCANSLISQQKKQMAQIKNLIANDDPEIQVPSFCLSINNNQRSSKHCLELQKFCQSKTPDAFHKERIENIFSSVHKGFLNLCAEAAACMALSVIISISKDTIAHLFTNQWIVSRPVSIAFTTMEDYDKDIIKWVASDFYVRKFRKRFFEIFLQGYLERIVEVFKFLHNCNYKFILLTTIPNFQGETLSKNDLNQMLAGTFKELLYRDKAEFLEFSTKFEIGFNSDTFFSGLIKIREGGELESLEKAIQPFIPNSKDLIASIKLVLTGKKV
jgi:phosphopantetheine adenylyltransferase